MSTDHVTRLCDPPGFSCQPINPSKVPGSISARFGNPERAQEGSRQIQEAPKGIPSDSESPERDPVRFRKLRKGLQNALGPTFGGPEAPKGIPSDSLAALSRHGPPKRLGIPGVEPANHGCLVQWPKSPAFWGVRGAKVQNQRFPKGFPAKPPLNEAAFGIPVAPRNPQFEP